MVTFFGMGNRDFFCKHCGFAVCGTCSKNSKYLSKDATEKYRVCDLCDTKLDNIRLKLIFEHLQQLKDRKLAILDKLIQRKKETLARLKQNVLEEEEQHEIEVEKINQKKEEVLLRKANLESQLQSIKVEITFLNA